MPMKDEFKIKAFQNFEKYFKINPGSTQITDPEIQNNLFWKYYKNINTDLLLIVFYLAHQYKKITLYLLQQND